MVKLEREICNLEEREDEELLVLGLQLTAEENRSRLANHDFTLDLMRQSTNIFCISYKKDNFTDQAIPESVLHRDQSIIQRTYFTQGE